MNLGQITTITKLPIPGSYYLMYLLSESDEEKLKNLEEERKILQNLFGEDNKSVIIRNFFDLYSMYSKVGNQKQALLYFEKAAHFATNKREKLRLLNELVYLLYLNKDKKLQYSIKEYNKIDVVFEAIVLEFFNFPYD